MINDKIIGIICGEILRKENPKRYHKLKIKMSADKALEKAKNIRKEN